MIKFVLMFCGIFLAGCNSAKVKKTTSFLDDFQQSGSMCIDALSVNLAKSNCLEVNKTEAKDDENLVFLRCVSSVDGYQNYSWNQMVFVVIQNKDEHSLTLLGDNEVFCIDTKTILGIVLPEISRYNGLPDKQHPF